MADNRYPFAAVAGQQGVKNALIYNLIEPRIGGVLLCGEKGTAKSTVVRGLAALTEQKVVDLPLSVIRCGVGVGLDLFRPLGRGAGQDFSPGADELEAGLRALKQKTQELNRAGIPFRFRELERIRKRSALNACGSHYCYAQTDASFCVDGRGNLWPCSSLAGDGRYYLGNIADGLPERARDSLEGLNPPAKCRACASYAHCLGGCPAARQEEINPLTCRMYRTLLEEETDL